MLVYSQQPHPSHCSFASSLCWAFSQFHRLVSEIYLFERSEFLIDTSQKKSLTSLLYSLGTSFEIPKDDSKQLFFDDATGASRNLGRFGRNPAMHPPQTRRPPLRKRDNIRTVSTLRKTENKKQKNSGTKYVYIRTIVHRRPENGPMPCPP